jgi:alkylated DNA repair dioxygenase AlkB
VPARPTAPQSQPDLFGKADAQPAGFAYRADMLAPAQEAQLVQQIQALPFAPFEFHGYLGKRRIVSFGWRYDYAGRAVRKSDPMPAFLEPLRALAGRFAQLEPETLQQVLVTEYAAGAGIGWHRDKPQFGDVIAFSLLAPCTLRFRRPQGDGWQRAKLPIAPRSAYLLRGPARWEWYHSIPPVDALRYSVTFRNFVAGTGADPA